MHPPLQDIVQQNAHSIEHPCSANAPVGIKRSQFSSEKFRQYHDQELHSHHLGHAHVHVAAGKSMYIRLLFKDTFGVDCTLDMANPIFNLVYMSQLKTEISCQQL